MARAVLNVSNICCEGCEGNITSILEPVAGVRSVRVDIPEKLVQVEYDEATLGIEQVKGALEDKQYTVESATA